MSLGDDILMLNRNDGDVDPDHASGAPREIPRRRHDVLADDVALVGDHLPFAALKPLDRGDGGMTVDLAAAVAGRARQRLGQVGGLDVAVLRMLDRADDSVDVAQRPNVLDLGRRQELHLDAADRRGDAGIIIVLVEPVAGAREADVGHLAQADVEARLLFERLVESDRIFVDLPDRITEIEQGQKPGRMPGRAGGQLLAFDENAVGPTLLDEMVERRDADHAPADHHRPRMRSHRNPSSIWRLPPPPRLRAVPLPRFTGEDPAHRGEPRLAKSSHAAKRRGGGPREAWWRGRRRTSQSSGARQ